MEPGVTENERVCFIYESQHACLLPGWKPDVTTIDPTFDRKAASALGI